MENPAKFLESLLILQAPTAPGLKSVYGSAGIQAAANYRPAPHSACSRPAPTAHPRYTLLWLPSHGCLVRDCLQQHR